ncbi:MAG: COX15/CtaA family protein [Terracidiphilus sp.]|jgi:cytochrome c oxidase assembly protein subunit 15
MSATAVSVHTHRHPSPALQRFAWSVLAFFIATILWGAVVRATGSGAGCGDNWPLCNGTVMQQSPTLHTMIEFSHRVSAGAIDSILVLALAVWTWRRTGAGHLARWAIVTAIFLTVTEGALGAVLVKMGLTAQSRSPLRAPVEALHFSNTLLLLAALTLTAHFLGRHAGFLRGKVRIAAPFVGIASVVLVLVVGVTGSLAALGDTLFPPSSLGAALAQDFSSASEWLVRWRWTHPTVAFLASVFLIWLLVRAARQCSHRGSHWDNRALSALVLILLALQYVLGILDVAFLAPLWLQIAHLLGADILWSAIVVLAARLTIEPVEAS